MRALAIDTATEMCSVALSIDGEVHHREVLAENRHSSMILGMIDELLVDGGLLLNQLDLLVNDIGPGSFTGIRIGLGVAQGLALGADLPLLGVDALSSMAHAVGPTELNIIAMIDARMGQLYWGHYHYTNGHYAKGRLALQDVLHLSEPAALESISSPVHVIGSGWDAYTDLLPEILDIQASSTDCFPLAQHGLALALMQSQTAWVAAGELSPVYLRNDVAQVSKKPGLLPR